jgi:hypothetical protein
LQPLGIDVVVIQAGAFPTEVNNKGLYAADAARAADMARWPASWRRWVRAWVSSSPAPLHPTAGCRTQSKLIDTPAGGQPGWWSIA